MLVCLCISEIAVWISMFNVTVSVRPQAIMPERSSNSNVDHFTCPMPQRWEQRLDSIGARVRSRTYAVTPGAPDRMQVAGQKRTRRGGESYIHGTSLAAILLTLIHSAFPKSWSAALGWAQRRTLLYTQHSAPQYCSPGQSTVPR